MWRDLDIYVCRFIDYEYAGFNPVALDIANHWCEYAGRISRPIPALHIGTHAILYASASYVHFVLCKRSPKVAGAQYR